MAQIKDIVELDGRIRDRINDRRVQHSLMSGGTNWHQVCSSLDVLGDTALALQSYNDLEFPTDIGTQYITLYGVLQALFLQQDAIAHMAEALGISFTLPPELKLIREIRNDAIGHPTKRGHAAKSYHFITRMSLSKSGFTVISTSFEGRDHVIRDIRTLQLISQQTDLAVQLCSSMITAMDEREEQHKAAHRSVKVADIFPSTMGYYFSKVLEGTLSDTPGHKEWARIHIQLIKELYDAFTAEVTKRGELTPHSWLEFHVNEVMYPIQKLLAYFQFDGSSNLEARDAHVFAEYLADKHESMAQIAKDIDEKYAE